MCVYVNWLFSAAPGKKRRLTFMECNNDINSMIDLAKVADLVSVSKEQTDTLNLPLLGEKNMNVITLQQMGGRSAHLLIRKLVFRSRDAPTKDSV